MGTTSLAIMTRASQMLAEATTIQKAKELKDLALTAADWARRKDMGEAAIQHCRRYAMLAERRMGEMLAVTERAKGTRGQLKGRDVSGCTIAVGPDNSEPTLAELGLSRKESSAAKALAGMPDAEFENVLSGSKTAKQAYKEAKAVVREAAKAAQVAKMPKRPLLYKADAFEWMEQQQPCDLLLTDPPYSTDIGDIEAFAPRVVALLSHVKPTGRAYICIGAYPAELTAYLTAAVPEPMTLAQVLVWTYRNTMGPAPKMKYALNWQAILYYTGASAAPLDCPALIEHQAVQDISAPQGGAVTRLHAWQKPAELAERFIRHATTAGAVVLDPFAGTGTFLLAATHLGREARGCEIDPAMIAIAVTEGCRRG